MSTKKEWAKINKDISKVFEDQKCCQCKIDPFEILIIGYCKDGTCLELCKDCATQLARKLLEDLCVYTKGGRHG